MIDEFEFKLHLKKSGNDRGCVIPLIRPTLARPGDLQPSHTCLLLLLCSIALTKRLAKAIIPLAEAIVLLAETISLIAETIRLLAEAISLIAETIRLLTGAHQTNQTPRQSHQTRHQNSTKGSLHSPHMHPPAKRLGLADLAGRSVHTRRASPGGHQFHRSAFETASASPKLQSPQPCSKRQTRARSQMSAVDTCTRTVESQQAASAGRGGTRRHR
mmetsp:Transcript_19869/g.43238  ORF Transcript_19869/g.43238 Transcript_19869/m.43238 type:complete len:216 (+) Transcript_19869:193-840(+)